MKENAIRVMIVDDHPIVLSGLAATLNPEPDIEVVAKASNGPDAVLRFREVQPDVTLMDLSLTREMTGTQAIEAIRREFPNARIIAFTAFDGDEDIYRALEAGATTYVLKESFSEDLIPIVREVHAGGGPIPPAVGRKLADRVRLKSLSPREVEILTLIAAGQRNKDIAERLFISEATVEGHMSNIFSKLAVNDRTKAVTVAIRRGILRID